MSKSENFLKFPKNEKVTKSHFRVFAYVYEEIGGPGRSKSQKCVLSDFLHFGAPESARSDFLTLGRRFCSIWELQNHFWRFWSKKSSCYPKRAPMAPKGSNPLTDRRGSVRPLTDPKGGVSTHLPLRLSLSLLRTAPQQT